VVVVVVKEEEEEEEGIMSGEEKRLPESVVCTGTPCVGSARAPWIGSQDMLQG
jgi:hypothetical protein